MNMLLDKYHENRFTCILANVVFSRFIPVVEFV